MLPTGYKLLEYIESSGTQYIDTGFVPTSKSRIVMDTQFTSTPTANSALFGSRNGDNNEFWVYWRYSDSCFVIRYGTDGSGAYLSTTVTSTDRNVIDMNKNVLSVGDVSVTNSQTAADALYPAFLFAVNAAGTASYISSLRVYSCQIYDNGTLVRQFVPCINDSGEVGLYDEVNDQFYGDAAGVGFTAGPKLFPARWIRSTGSQYIDTEFIPNQDTRVVCKAICEVTGSTNWLFGARKSSSSNAYGFTASAYGYYNSGYNTNSKSFSTSCNSDGIILIDKNKETTTLTTDDTTETVTGTTGTFTTPVNLTLFAGNTNGSLTYGSVTIYSCKIYDNGALVRDYVPMVDADGVGGLYDRVNYTFERDAAGVGFEAMPELAELEYIESSGTQYIDTSFKPNQDTRVVMDINSLSYVQTPYFGARTDATTNSFTVWQLSATTFRSDHCLNSANQKTGTLSTVVGRYTVDKNKNVSTVNGVTVTNDENDFSCAYSLFLLTGNTAGTPHTNKLKAQLYSCQIYDNGTMVRDYIPVLASYGAVGLYDRLNDELYLDAAGGSFIAGPVVVSGLPAPENLTASVTEVGGVELTWDAVKDALFYTVLQDGIAVAATTETTYSLPLVPFANTIYGVTAANDEFESAPAEVLVQYIPEEYDLITDRTSSDVQRVKYLRETGWAAMTTDERMEFLSPLKGSYNASDLNRVEYAAKQLAERLNDLPVEFRDHAAELGVAWNSLFDIPYTPPSIETRHDWTVWDIPDSDSMSRYLDNITLLRGLLDYATASLPVSMDGLTYTGANAIEAALKGLFAAILALQADRLTLINNTAAAWMYSGEIYGGDV